MAFYKITDEAKLAEIHDFMEKRREYLQGIESFVESLGLTNFSVCYLVEDELYSGIMITGVGIEESRINELDTKKWKSGKTRNGMVVLRPRKVNKELYELYQQGFAKPAFSYLPFFKLIFAEGERYCPFTKNGLGYCSSLGNMPVFLFETSGYALCSEAVEIPESEYLKLKSEIKAHFE